MSLDELYAFAEEHGIKIHDFNFGALKSMSVPDNIGINYHNLSGTLEEKTLLFHEMGHCVTGCFYQGKSPLDLKTRHEFRANKWSFMKQIPVDDLRQAVQKGYKETWELAEYFEADESVVIRAITYYRENGMI